MSGLAQVKRLQGHMQELRLSRIAKELALLLQGAVKRDLGCVDLLEQLITRSPS